MWPFGRHDWEYLGEYFLLDAYQFSGGMDFTGYRLRRCRRSGLYQYKSSFWRDCEVSGNGRENTVYYLCQQGFRKAKGLCGDLSPTYAGKVELCPVNNRSDIKGGD